MFPHSCILIFFLYIKIASLSFDKKFAFITNFIIDFLLDLDII